MEDILDMRMQGGKREFLIRWSGYGSDHNSWEVRETACLLEPCSPLSVESLLSHPLPPNPTHSHPLPPTT